jgi:8-oxo-dGTP diphosphatase
MTVNHHPQGEPPLMILRQQVSVAGLIDSRGSVLVMRRSAKEGFLPGVFVLPGGKVKFGESPEEAIRREIAEETALEIADATLVAARSYMSMEGAQHNIELIFDVKLHGESCNVVLSNAHDEYRWVRPNELDGLQLPEKDPIRIAIHNHFSTALGPTNCPGALPK